MPNIRGSELPEIGIVCFLYHLGIYNENIILFDIIRVWVFDGIFVFDTIQYNYHARTFIPR